MNPNKDPRSSKEKIMDSMKKDEEKPLTRANFSFKKVFIGDWKNFAIFAMLMFLVWSYSHDTAACREMISNIDEICLERAIQVGNTNLINLELNFSGDTYSRRCGEDSWTVNQSGSPNIVQGNS